MTFSLDSQKCYFIDMNDDIPTIKDPVHLSMSPSSRNVFLFLLSLKHIFLILLGEILILIFFKVLSMVAYVNHHLPEDFLSMESEDRFIIQKKIVEEGEAFAQRDPIGFIDEFYRILTTESPSLLLWNSILWILAFVIPGYIFLHKISKYPLPDFNASWSPKEIGKGVALGAIVFTLVNIVMFTFQQIGMKIEANHTQKLLLMALKENVLLLVWSIYTVGLITGLFEELFFRGYLLDNYIFAKNQNFGLIFTSILFGALHYSPEASIMIPIILSFVGMFFGLVYIYTKNIWITAIVHATYNSLGVLVAYLVGDQIG